MLKPCACGQEMAVQMRTVIYRNKVEIDNVPVYTCDTCSRSEVYPQVKQNLARLILDLGSDPERQTLRFDETDEVARLIKTVCDHGLPADGMKPLVSERINELLDMLLLARSLQDDGWESDVRVRLSQLAPHSLQLPLIS